MNHLVAKYNKPGPRYTSYPPVPFWHNIPSETEWIGHIKKIYSDSEGIDLYVHVPFCEKLCYYCGCNRIVTKNHSSENNYVQLILKEWMIYCEKLGFTPKVNSLHFGGGTPTFLSPEHLDLIIKTLTKNKTEHFLGSIEIDPRNVTKAHLDCLSDNGISRVSLGIQDFDPGVQKAINREQSFDLVHQVVEMLRVRNFESINFDIIYGLPKQTIETITETFNLVRKLRPDMIAYYSYAHLPERLKNQRLIKNSDLPSAELKQKLYEVGKELLALDEYEDIGMDHFALKSNFLYQAKLKQSLHRNFMGYVDKKSPILIGLGASSISDSSLSFIQNEKGLNEYELKIKSGKLAISSGHIHSSSDLVIQTIILSLMCKDQALLNNKDSIPFYQQIEADLADFTRDGLVEKNDDKLVILPAGKKFIRNIAMTFDFYLREKEQNTKFSQTI